MSKVSADASLEMAPARAVFEPAAAGIALLRLARQAPIACLERLLLWQDRASQRHRLSMMDAHALWDVGLTRADLEPEIRKPFWRP